jgi:hypothetical protein
MTTFKICDLVISIAAGESDGLPPPRCIASTPGCDIRHLKWDLKDDSPGELAALRTELAAVLSRVVGQELVKVEPKQIEALEVKLTNALAEVRAKKEAAGSKS